MNRPRLGQGKNMSISQAGLIYYYKVFLPESFGVDFIYSGDLDAFHKIVDIAGAKQCSWFTHHQVLNCLRSSPYWQKCGTIPRWNKRKEYEHSVFVIT